jgi:hypothetical protein
MKRIPAFKLVPEPLTEEARQLPGFRWAADNVGKRHRLGGAPEAKIAPEHWPTCPSCESHMSFYGQLDSLNDEFCIADAGLVCVFICFDCNEVKSTIESA